MKSFPEPKRTMHTKHKSQSTVMNTTITGINFGEKGKLENQDLISEGRKFDSVSKEEKLQQKFLFYTNDYMKEHNYQEIKVSDFQKKYHIVDSPQVIFKIADIIHQKQNSIKIVTFPQNWQQDLKKTSLHTSQSKFRHNSGERKKFYNLIEDLRDQISKLDNNKNLTISQTFQYKQHVLTTYFYGMIHQIQKQCFQKAKLMQSIWSSNISLMNVMFKTLIDKLNQNQSKYLTQIQKMHSEYQRYLKEYFQQNKVLKKDNREKSEFIQNLVFNLRYKRKEIKHLNTSIGLATSKLNQYKDLYIELENRHIELQMETKDISKQLSRFLIQRKKLLVQEKKKKFKLNQNKLKIKKIIFQQLKNESELIAKDINKTLLESYTRSRKQRGDKYLMIDDMDEFALKINDEDDYPFIIEDQDFGFVEKGINTDQIHFPLAEAGVQYDKNEIQQKSYQRNMSVQVNSINEFNYFNKLKDHIKNKFNIVQKIIDIQLDFSRYNNLQIEKYRLIIKSEKSDEDRNYTNNSNILNTQENLIKKSKRGSKLEISSNLSNPKNVNKRFRNSIAYFKKEKIELSNLAEIIEQEQRTKDKKSNRSSNFKIKNKMSLTKSSTPDIDYLVRQGKKNQSRLDERRSSQSIFNNNLSKNKNNNSKLIKKFPYKIIFDKRKSNSENFVIKLVDDHPKNQSNKDDQQQSKTINQMISDSHEKSSLSPLHKKFITQSAPQNKLYLSTPIDPQPQTLSKSSSTPFYRQIMKEDSIEQIYPSSNQLQSFNSKFKSQQLFSILNLGDTQQDNIIQKRMRKESIQCPENQYKLLDDQQQNRELLEKCNKGLIRIDDGMEVGDIQQVLCKYLSALKKRKRNDLINEKEFLRNSLIQLSKLLKNRPKRRDSICINEKSNNSKIQNIIKTINEIYDIGYKCINKKDQLKSISECIYESFRLSYGRLDKHLIEQKIIYFLNMVNCYKIKNQKIQFFALMCGMQEENPNTSIICGIDFILFLKLYFHLNQQWNINSEICYTTIQRFNEGFNLILNDYIGQTKQLVIKKQLETLLYCHQNQNQSRQNLKINSEETIIFIFNQILKSRLVFHQEYEYFLNILKTDEFEIVQIQTFQFLVSCFEHKKIEYAHIIKNFTEQCDLNFYDKKSMSGHKFTYFCLKYNFHTFQEIYEICVENLKERNLNQVTTFFQNDQSVWIKQMQYMTKQLNRGNKQMIIETKLFKYMSESFTNNLKENKVIIQMVYTMLWNKIFEYQSQRFLTFTIGKHFELLYSYGFQVIHNTDI